MFQLHPIHLPTPGWDMLRMSGSSMKKVLLSISLLFLLSYGHAQSKWSPPSVVEVAKSIPEDREQAAKLIRKSFGSRTLQAGKHWIEGSRILWMVESEQPVSVFNNDGKPWRGLERLDEKGLQAAVENVENPSLVEYELKSADGTIISSGSVKVEHYPRSSDSEYQPGIPRGQLFRHSFNESETYPTTNRELEVYVPAQYEKGTPAALMVFQDGLRHADVQSEHGLRTPVVMDNLIASGEMPVTIGIFINPGMDKSQEKGKPRNRSVEYDSLGDRYVTFLIEEIIPFVTAKHELTLSEDPRFWAIAGGSSGCACAFTAAWERPDRFGKVLGWVGTFVDIRGAHAYPSMIRKTDLKPIRLALLGESQDLDNQFGNWPLANHQMEAALRFKDYDYRYWWGNGFHGSKHAAAMLPEMMKWLWSDVATSKP